MALSSAPPSLPFPLQCCLFAVVLEEFRLWRKAQIAKHWEATAHCYFQCKRKQSEAEEGPADWEEGKKTYKAGYAETQI